MNARTQAVLMMPVLNLLVQNRIITNVTAGALCRSYLKTGDTDALIHAIREAGKDVTNERMVEYCAQQINAISGGRRK